MSLPKSLNNKFNSDLIWNIVAFGGIVVIGILLNILIIKSYDESVLGAFNQVYAVYILLSQIAVGGVHLSIQYFIPRYSGNKNTVSVFILTAFIISAAFSTVTVLSGYILKNQIGYWLHSEAVEQGIKYVIWGLFFFSFNKILLSVHNGLRNMKIFAGFQLLRFLLILIFFFIFTHNNYSPDFLPAVFSFAELTLFILLFIASAKYIKPESTRRGKKIFFIQFKYGNKALAGNFLLDVNTKVDIFILGLFLNDAKVGIYSFASTIAEGFMQLPVLYRNNINPIITSIAARRNYDLLERVLHKNIRNSYKLLAFAGIASIIFFPLFHLIFKLDNFNETFTVYILLAGGVIITAGYHPLLTVLNQLGKPELQTRYFFFIFISNVIFNLLFVPILGIYGAATGTALSFIIQVMLLKFYLKKHLKISV